MKKMSVRVIKENERLDLIRERAYESDGDGPCPRCKFDRSFRHQYGCILERSVSNADVKWLINLIDALNAQIENMLHKKPLFKTVEEYLASDMAKADSE